jgi:hypothetical protein
MLSEERGWVCRLQLLLVLGSAFILKSESRRTHDFILLSQIREFPNLEDQMPVFTSPRSRVAQELGSRFVASYNSQGCGGYIRPHLHTASTFSSQLFWDPHYVASGQTQQKTPFHSNSSIVTEVCLLRRCIETAVLLLCACSFPREPVNRTVA